MRRGIGSVGLLALVAALGAFGGSARGQGSDAALKDRVAGLVGRLDSDKADAADAAQKTLIELGPRVLPLLDEASKASKAGAKARLDAVRAALAKAAESTDLGASKVTLKGDAIRLTEAIKALQAKTGNVITDLREQQGGDAPNPALDLDIVDKPFLEALDMVAAKAGVTVSGFTGDGSLGLMPGGPSGAPSAPKPIVVYTGPFRVQLKQIAAARDFTAGTSSANVQLELIWEPRLRPMLLALKADGLKAVDDAGRAVAPSVTEATEDVTLRAENPAAEINLNLDAPDRSAKELATLKVKGEITIPAGLKTFRFKAIDAVAVVQTQGDISVTLESTTVDEQVWRVALAVAYPGGGPAFESYRQGLFNNRIWLQKADGSRFEHNGGMNNTGGDGGKLGFEYLFVDVPGKLSDYGLVYETPSKVLTIPLEFEFKGVKLP